jgi:hypothetical protein
MGKRKRFGLADGEQTSYDKVASYRRRFGVNHCANLTPRTLRPAPQAD